MEKNYLPATLLCDFYKISHREQYPEGTEMVYSTWTPRVSRIEGINKVVAFGFQAFIKEYLIDYFNENFFNRPLEVVIEEYERVVKHCLGIEKPETQHIKDLHNLGYLPLRIKAVKEGTRVPIRVPMLTIENTIPKFFWLTNYIETLFSCTVWQPCTSATIAYEYRQIMDKYAMETVGNTDFVQFQGHDFSMRGMGGLQGSAYSSAGHLLPFVGTDTIPSILFHERFYNANIENELVGTSIPASEHSVMCSYGKEKEFDTYKRFITELYPSGIASIVSDTWDFWKVLSDIIVPLKEDILSREGKIVIRPDSGDPVDIVCGNTAIEDLDKEEDLTSLEDCQKYMKEVLVETVREETPHGECGDDEIKGTFKFQDKYYEIKIEIDWNRYDKQYYYIDGNRILSCEEIELSQEQKGAVEVLWDIFGGTVNELGYKELDPHIGLIYGDAITLERCKTICARLKQKGFASSNIVFGVGSYSYQMRTRDTFGFAIKSTHVKVDGKERKIFKDPKTDDGVKKSQKGMVVVYEDKDEIKFKDNLTEKMRKSHEEKGKDMLELVFVNGNLFRDEKLSDIRERLLNK